MNLRSQNGFSLVELTVVVGILSIVLYFTMSLINTQMSSLKIFENKLSVFNLASEVKVLAASTQCDSALSLPVNFGNPNVPTNNNFEIRDKFGNLFLSSNPSSPKSSYEKLNVDSIILVNSNGIAPNNSGVAELLVFLSANNSKMKLAPVKIPVEVTLSPSGQAIKCGDVTGGDWNSMPSGSHCGVYMQTQGSVKAQRLCEGHNPKNSCPTGFTRADLGYFEAGNGPRQYATCIKN